jgi:hypothetical protein
VAVHRPRSQSARDEQESAWVCVGAIVVPGSQPDQHEIARVIHPPPPIRLAIRGCIAGLRSIGAAIGFCPFWRQAEETRAVHHAAARVRGAGAGEVWKVLGSRSAQIRRGS